MIKQSFTILISEKKYDQIRNRIYDQLKEDFISIQGNEYEWEKIEIKEGGLMISFNSLVRTKPMDQFSKIILGIYNFIDKKDEKTDKKYVLDKIANTKLLIGVVINTIPNQKVVDFIRSVLLDMDAIVFNGETILDNNLEPM